MGEYSYLIGLNKSMHVCKMLGIGLHSYEILKRKKKVGDVISLMLIC